MTVLKKNDSVVVIDYIKNSDLTSNVKEIVPQDKLVVLDFEDTENLQSLSYNELNYTDDMSKNNKMRAIYYKAKSSLELLNCLNDKELSNMAKIYFSSMATIVYSVNQFASLKDIVNCLTDCDTRMDYINRVPKDLKEIIDDEINTVLRLDTVLSTRKSVEEILSTTCLLEQFMKTNFMFKNTSENNINFENCFDEGKVIVIKINDDISDNKNIKDMLTLFFVTKVHTACKNRAVKLDGNQNRVHLVIDDAHTMSNTLKQLENIIPQTRVVNLKPVLAVQNLSQLPNSTLQTMNISGFNFMFLSGLDEKAYKILESDLSPYTFDDVKNIEKYHSLNLVLNNDGRREVFLTKLPVVLEVCNIK